MKEKINLKSLFVSIILILAGFISPSNGLDDATHKSPKQMLYAIAIIIVSIVSIYLVWTALENYKKESKTDS
jgi:divalent metal cation (Fe/Co/Zn/Cd) transporter